jgi:hypothetical protein
LFFDLDGPIIKPSNSRKEAVSMWWSDIQSTDVDELIFGGDEQVIVSDR